MLLLPLALTLAPPATAAPPPSADAAAPSAPPPSAETPTGPLVARFPPRPSLRTKACSFRHPLCVHGDASPPSHLLAALDAAERAWDTATGALALPPPDADIDTGAYDVYLVDRPPGAPPAITASGARDPRTRIDRTSAYTLFDRTIPPGCAMDALLAREVARASLFRAAPATDDGSARAETAYLARLLAPCALGWIDGTFELQAHPERPIVDTWSDEPRTGEAYDRGAALFFWWLDASYGAEPGAIVRAMWTLSPTMTPPGAFRWTNEPDGFDVLRFTFKNALTTQSTIDDLFLEFAAARALLGAADDGTQLPEARSLGAALRPRLDWEIDWPAKPRRLASPVGVFPTGAAYVAVRHAGAPAAARLRVEASWEEHAKMRWLALKLDAAGREKGRIVIPVTERATDAQITVVDLDGVDTVLLVATNAGDADYPFDPDDAIWEPHGWTLTLAAE